MVDLELGRGIETLRNDATFEDSVSKISADRCYKAQRWVQLWPPHLCSTSCFTSPCCLLAVRTFDLTSEARHGGETVPRHVHSLVISS